MRSVAVRPSVKAMATRPSISMRPYVPSRSTTIPHPSISGKSPSMPPPMTTLPGLGPRGKLVAAGRSTPSP